jgi:hypothetical protein
VCRGLTLIHPEPRRPAAYGASSDLTTTPSCPCASASRKNSLASVTEPVTRRGISSSGGTVRASSACRRRSGRSIRSTPSACSTSNRNTESWTAGVFGFVSWLAVRAAVSWKGSGLPSARSAISSPSKTAARTGSLASAATTSGSRPVISSKVLVNRRTAPSARWAWILMPSSFHSTAAPAVPSAALSAVPSAALSAVPSAALSAVPSAGVPPPILARASAMLEALAASIGRTGRPTSRPKACRASRPPASAPAATAPSEPRIIIARRTSATGTEAARATASVITPSSAPCRSSPESRPYRNCCSVSVARPNNSLTSAFRAAVDPLPEIAPIAENPASTSLSVSVAAAAGANPPRSVAQPTPICRCGSSPDRYATAIGTSRGPAWRSAAASASILASRALVVATVRDTPAISARSTRPFSLSRRSAEDHPKIMRSPSSSTRSGASEV